MKKLLIASLIASLALTACNQQETPASEPKTTAQPAEHTDDHEHKESDHKEGEHAHDHDDHKDSEHAHGEHEGHAHHHHEGDRYKCDNDKTIAIAIHDHEGEIEAHATIDDIEYDLSPVEEKENAFISLHEGLNDKGMKMLKDGEKLTFTDLDDKPLLGCTLSKTL